MWILGLEAGAALLLLVFIVWWTMFAGRPKESSATPLRAPERPAAPNDRAPSDRPGSGPGTGG